MNKHLASENGSVILMVILILALVSLYGITALNSSMAELTIARNGRLYKQNLYRAEGELKVAGQILNQDSSPEEHLRPTGSDPYSWVQSKSSTSGLSEWVYVENGNTGSSGLYSDNDSKFTVVFEGVAQGASLSMGGSQNWQYNVYGASEIGGGRVGVVSGFRMRF